VIGQRPSQGQQGERPVQAAPQLPRTGSSAPDAAREHVHDHGQVDELAAEPEVCVSELLLRHSHLTEC